MPFCINCGQQLADGAKFCAGCGVAVNGTNQSTQRKAVYDGEIHKCPNCGEVLNSFVSNCPACGYELRGSSSTSVVKDFALQLLNACDEHQKLVIIRNFIVPNTKEDILEFFILASTNSGVKYDSAKIAESWRIKLEQCYKKAEIVLNNDPDFEKIKGMYKQAYKKVEQYQNKQTILTVFQTVIHYIGVIFRAIGKIINFLFRGFAHLWKIGNNLTRLILCLGLIVLIWMCYNVIKPGEFDPFADKNNFVWLQTGLSPKIPQIENCKGEYQKNSDTELWIRIEDLTYNQFEQYVIACQVMGYEIDTTKGTDDYSAYNEEGYYLELQYWGYSDKDGPLDIELKAPVSGEENFSWPEGELVDLIPSVKYSSGKVNIEKTDEIDISLFEFTSDEYDSYIIECRNAGFYIDSEESATKNSSSYQAYNSEGYRIRVMNNNMKELKINIQSPRNMDAITWPSSGPATLLPEPSCNLGEISSNYDWAFSVYIGDITVDNFNVYVEECIANGFELDVRTDHYFSANKGDNISLIVEYVGFNTIFISITDYEKL